MDSSETHEDIAQPINPVEPEVIDLDVPLPPASAGAVDTAAPVPAPVLAEPGMYWCEEEYSGSHPILGGLIHQGENDLTMITHEEQLAAIAALVEAGVLMGPM